MLLIERLHFTEKEMATFHRGVHIHAKKRLAHDDFFLYSLYAIFVFFFLISDYTPSRLKRRFSGRFEEASYEDNSQPRSLFINALDFFAILLSFQEIGAPDYDMTRATLHAVASQAQTPLALGSANARFHYAY